VSKNKAQNSGTWIRLHDKSSRPSGFPAFKPSSLPACGCIPHVFDARNLKPFIGFNEIVRQTSTGNMA
jgi:hypothetical protein